MQYGEVRQAHFLERPNRFIAHVELEGETVVCHVKNTGRCRELLVRGATVYLERGTNPARRTAWDLIAVEKGHAQAPNRIFAQWIHQQEPEITVHPEYRYGDSRLDFCLERPEGLHLVEVKGVTLEREGHCLFPDAPTERGVRHLHELMRAVEEGHRATAFFVIQMADVLDLSEDSVLTRLGVGKHLKLAADAKETLTAALSGGAFPGIPAALGDSVQGLIDTYQLLNDPDLAGDQRMISLEDGAFRNVYILTDNLTRKLDSSVAQSIRADRLMLLGLVTGSTTQDEWRQALGEPTRTVSVSAESAELRRLCAGQTDYYAWWSNATLCLHADEDGVLRTVMLMQAENGGEN